MKKVIDTTNIKQILISILLTMLMLSACNNKKVSTQNNDLKQNIDNETITSDKSAETAKPLKKNNVYKNTDLGFELTFPESWDEYYKVHDTDGGIHVYFYGRSNAGKGEQFNNGKGLSLFMILDEETVSTEILDSVKKIGTAKGINYYYATATDLQLAPIIIPNDNLLKEYVDMYGEELYGNAQISLIKHDWEKAQQMQKDIPGILETFKGEE